MGCVNHQNMGGLLWLYEHYILPEMDEMFTPFLSFSIQYNQTPNITLANMRTETLRFGVLWVQQRVRCRVWIRCPSTVSLGDLFFTKDKSGTPECQFRTVVIAHDSLHSSNNFPLIAARMRHPSTSSLPTVKKAGRRCGVSECAKMIYPSPCESWIWLNFIEILDPPSPHT